ncbi:MAG: flagellar basal body P-ring formation protein FlgA [Opitutus sp.]|nr:flagellar basal body P-ring formation protein FlgA [Opitutus sp.]MCS6247738.1 flagellar basal body P-ring formation protein FlgA [Opitutus sp.]MCS6274268.1 flagellar basal body P-ring formation protein FlgA [Opitutus sp.]MCS6277432.1 flagellar basal body P-ring formation protein FlgA [Opitutus sp.]MCS6300549.1 flagellar basal body P-ring formation protein FlgA [Opitutus sp.]
MSRRYLVLGLFCALATFGQAQVQAAPASATGATASAPDPWLETLCALLTDRYQVTGQLNLAWNRPRPAATPVEADLVVVTASAELAPQILVTVRATDSAGVKSDHMLVLRAELWRDGWMVRDPVTAGSRLDPLALDPRRFDALRERDSIPADPKLDLNFARNMPMGRLVAWRDVVRRPLVRRGQAMEVIATSGALTVTLNGIALNDAASGETVRVRNPDSKKEFVAQVVSESRATIRF